MSGLLWISGLMCIILVTLAALFASKAILTDFRYKAVYARQRAWVCVIGAAWFAGLAVVLRYVFGAAL